MDVKLTLLFCTIATIVGLSQLSEPAGLARAVAVRWRQRRLPAWRVRSRR